MVHPLFLEQAAFCYLRMKYYRKFSFYIVNAGRIYEKLHMRHYSFNCFAMVQPYYSNMRWNGIRDFLYRTLGRDSFYLGNLQLSVKFFRNLLQLCCDIEDSSGQKECLEEFLSVVKKWNDIREQSNNPFEQEEGEQRLPRTRTESLARGVTDIGFLSLPVILEDSFEVFLNLEKIFTVTKGEEAAISSCFIILAAENDGTARRNIGKAEFNSPNCPWKFLARSCFDYIEEE